MSSWPSEQKKNQGLMGRLMYLTILSRFDTTCAAKPLTQFITSPRTPHLDAIHYLLQYLKATLRTNSLVSFSLFPSFTSLNIDVDWGSCSVTRVFLEDALIAWGKKQSTVACSSAEAGYRVLTISTNWIVVD